jgi:hypothetical protein
MGRGAYAGGLRAVGCWACDGITKWRLENAPLLNSDRCCRGGRGPAVPAFLRSRSRPTAIFRHTGSAFSLLSRLLHATLGSFRVYSESGWAGIVR